MRYVIIYHLTERPICHTDGKPLYFDTEAAATEYRSNLPMRRDYKVMAVDGAAQSCT